MSDLGVGLICFTLVIIAYLILRIIEKSDSGDFVTAAYVNSLKRNQIEKDARLLEEKKNVKI